MILWLARGLVMLAFGIGILIYGYKDNILICLAAVLFFLAVLAFSQVKKNK